MINFLIVILCSMCVSVNTEEVTESFVFNWEDTRYDRYIFPCRSTDFRCFQKQYKKLRDHVLMGNQYLGIPVFQPFTFQPVENSCVRITGLEQSWLSGLQFDYFKRDLIWHLELPFKIQEITSDAQHCNNINILGPHIRKFVGNATIRVTYPFKYKKGKLYYMSLLDESLDVVVDIPETTKLPKQKSKLDYDNAEWAYKVVQSIDAAEQFALPYTSQLQIVFDNFPMRRLFLLYPDERYTTLKFDFLDSMCTC